MASWAALFLAMIAPAVNKVLLALGMALVTLIGWDTIKADVVGAVMGNLSGIPADVLQILQLAGAYDALGYCFGALTYAGTLIGLKRLRVMP